PPFHHSPGGWRSNSSSADPGITLGKACALPRARVGRTQSTHLEAQALLAASRIAVAEADLAAALEDQLLPAQFDRRLSRQGDEGAVGAVVDEHPLLTTAFDGRVAPRRLGVDDNDVVARLAAERDAAAAGVEDPLAALACQVEEAAGLRFVHAAGGDHHG